MELSLSTQMAQQSLSDQVGTAVTRQSLQAQREVGADVVALIESAASAFTDPSLGRNIDLKA